MISPNIPRRTAAVRRGFAAGLGAALLCLVASCGEGGATLEQMQAALASRDAGSDSQSAAPGSGIGVQKNEVAQDLLDQLAATDNEAEAANLEEQIWEAWLLSGSATVDVLMKRGVAAFVAGDADLARDMFDRAIALRPDYAEAWDRRALIFYTEGKYDEAIADLERTLENEPRHFGAWTSLGLIFETMDLPDAALKAYRKALAIHPHALAAKQGAERLARRVEGRTL